MAPLSSTLSEYVQAAIAFESTTWADGSVLDDPWYTVEPETASAAPGTLLKVERTTDTSKYTLPPSTALSRIIYQSKSFNGSSIPVSAYILWPHTARSGPDGYHVVAWSHGTSGWSPNAAPSHIKNLWQHYLAPFQLALQGYVVIGTDYAGLGVSKTASGADIIHEYLTAPSQANDVFYSVEAAQTAFPELSKSFVVAGHSQGGGSAWAAAQRQVKQPVPGYLGAVALSPITNVVKLPEPAKSMVGASIATSMKVMFPDFDASEVLTPDGVEGLALAQKFGGNIATTMSLLWGYQLVKADWTEHPVVKNYQAIVENGGRAISGPLLVVHGEDDGILDNSLTTAAVEETARMFPKASIEYLRVPGTSHNGGMTSCQWMWMDWIAKRFEGIPAKPGVTNKQLATPVNASAYQKELNWWLAPAVVPFQTP